MSVTMSDKEIHRLPEVYAIAMQHHSPAFGMSAYSLTIAIAVLKGMRLMTAYRTEFFSMNDVNRPRILQDVIESFRTWNQ
ncbi:TPA: hypothetical protein G8L55_004486 [Salmonella enterica]|uniref:Uncharacterized protein n=4 Tax=Salmonella enterica TaxID=28901 RepID=I3W411_SALER|nr:hypothetical protein [Salmonella enterica]EAA4188698.1 hypothetical protein [Salmonella enterica subsp. enterica serovar Mikawasima]EAB7505623.1 hypothetical protein [Salmonella enterica subsp. enterica]EAC0381735.1 hypothetical protein [Salmonella enterica subsp. enterica serovar Potsdam]EBQ9892740.1 hypothetical protein [Salmonella enterica subsp. enterica serovar Hvittingfoss]EBR8658815.1 hypothetical protein [Salmonella enterica subsp. enterica serovar Kottbus]EBS1713759.1 hypothetical